MIYQNRDLIMSALYGAALFVGGKPNPATLARVMVVQRSQVGRWIGGEAVPNQRNLDQLNLLCKFWKNHLLEVKKLRDDLDVVLLLDRLKR